MLFLIVVIPLEILDLYSVIKLFNNSLAELVISEYSVIINSAGFDAAL